MSEKTQSFSNHSRYYPIWHFIAAPILAINAVLTGMAMFREPSTDTGWQFLVALALVLAVFASRTMSLMTQDRIIRGEERGRLRDLLPADMQASIERLTPPQLVGLRFASDEEVTDLTRKILDGSLSNQAAIKKAIENWRPDHMRV